MRLENHSAQQEPKYNSRPIFVVSIILVKLFLFLIPLIFSQLTFSRIALADSVTDLMQSGNLYRLRGDMIAANRIKDQMRGRDPNDPASYAFNLNTIPDRTFLGRFANPVRSSACGRCKNAHDALSE